jgi:hypothetical protein
VFMQHLLFCMDDCLVCRVCINTVVSPDDGHVVAPKHVEKRNKLTKKNGAPSWLYLQEGS